MHLSSFSLLLTFGLLLSVEVECRRRSKRETYHIAFVNESLPCEELTETLTHENGGRPPLWTQLNDEDMIQLLRMRGYDFMTPYMGASSRDARLISDPLLPAQVQSSMNTGSQPFLKSEILKRLHEARKARKDVPRSFYDVLAEESLQSGTTDAQFPYVLPEDIGINRTIFESDGFVTTVDYCIPRSNKLKLIEDVWYLSMCTACSTTTETPSDYWPSLLYGVICSPEDSQCLYDGSTAYGRCIATDVSITMLNKNPYLCLLVLENGQKMIAQDWSPVTYRLGIGCECAVSENSRFR